MTYFLTNTIWIEIQTQENVRKVYFKTTMLELNKVQLLLKNALIYVTREYQLLNSLIQLNLIYFQFNEMIFLVNNQPSKQNFSSKMDESVEAFTNMFNDCLKHECPGSIIFNYNIDQARLDALKQNKFHLMRLNELEQHSSVNLKCHYKHEDLLYCLFLSIEFPVKLNNQEFQFEFKDNYFLNRIVHILNDRLNESSLYELLLIRGNHDFRHAMLLDQFDQFIVKKIFADAGDQLLTDANMNSLCHCFDKEKKLIQKFVATLFENNWPVNNTDTLTFSVNSTIFNAVLVNDLKFNFLSKKWKGKFVSVLDMFVESINKICTGGEKISAIEFLHLNYEKCQVLIHLIREHKLVASLKLDKTDSKKLLQFRYKEVCAFKDYMLSMKAVMQLLAKFKHIQTNAYDKQLRKLFISDMNELLLTDVCACQTLAQILRSGANLNAFTPHITAFEHIHDKEIKLVNEMISLDRLKCVLFDSYFAESCEQVRVQLSLNCLPVTVAIENVFLLAKSKWQLIVDSIQSGTIKLVDIDRYLSTCFGNNFDKTIMELSYICKYFKIKNLNERIVQLERYRRFKSISEGAVFIEQIRRSLNMNHEFKELEILLHVKSAAFNEWTILHMDQSVENTIRILEKMNTAEKIRCLKTFVDALEFVKWLRTTTNNVNELKFLVDLASMDEKGTNKDLLAKALKEAGTAFAPLIFDLKVTDNFHRFMSLCEIVWLHLDTDKNICDKLLFIKDQIGALENIRLKKGNVELSTINQAKQINKKGVYKVGNLKSAFISSNGVVNIEGVTNISSLIELEIDLDAEKKSKKSSSVKSYEDLKELQSILILVAKNSTKTLDDSEESDEEALEYFIEIFNNIVRLAEILLKLLRNGCDFFDDFIVNVYCDITDDRLNAGNASLSIKLDSKYSGLKNSLKELVQNSTDSTVRALKNLCIFMETCVELWQSYFFSLRNQYKFINYFTTNQLIFLKANLGKIFFSPNLTPRDLNQIDLRMISFLLGDLVGTDLSIETLKTTFQLTLEKKSTFLHKTPKTELLVYETRVNQFINKTAYENKFRVSVVREAVKLYGCMNIDLITDYCLVNDMLEEEEEDESDQQLNDDDIEMTPIEQEELIEIDFNKRIDQIWSQFLKHQHGYCEHSLTFEHLAIYLELIRQEKHDYERQIPGYLTNKGNPNLIICPASEQISIALSIYAHTPEEPLPSCDEFLYCSGETSSEEVENFLRIAFKSNGSKIYTLLNMQDIKYENAALIEKFLSLSSQLEPSGNYNLVCICSQEKQSQSILAALLMRYRVKTIVLPATDLDEYLASKFIIDENRTDRNCPPHYDPQHSCVRALMSKKPGNGKSTFVKVFKQKLNFNYKIIRIKNNCLNVDNELNKLFEFKKDEPNRPTIYHIDIAFEVFHNVDLFLFNLLVVGCVKHSNGLIWRRSSKDLYMIEIMPPYLNGPVRAGHFEKNRGVTFHSMLNYLPRVQFRDPSKYLYDLINMSDNELRRHEDTLFSTFFSNTKFQRTCFYLKLMRESPDTLVTFDYAKRESLNFPDRLSQIECLKILLEYTELKLPNWSDLHNFVNFLDEQLDVLEKAKLIQQIPDFKNICAKFLIMMAYDFGLPSLNIGEESNAFCISENNQVQIAIHRLELARRWENMTHPYIIFNADRQTFTFMGIYLDRRKYKFINPNTNETMELPDIQLKPNLRIALLHQRVPIYENFNEFPRTKKMYFVFLFI